MCLGTPMKIKRIEGSFALVEATHLSRRISIEMLPKVKIGDYVIVHAGFAIQKLNPKAAEETLNLINEIH